MNTSSLVRWGLIGCGQIGYDKALPGLLAAKNASLVAIADVLESRRAITLDIVAKTHNARPVSYGDYHELLADPNIQAVYIALPTGMHAEAVIAAAKAGKAILCEKPLGRSAEEVCGMVRAARENGVPLMTAYMSRFGDVFQEATRLLRENTIGQVTFVSAHFSYSALRYYPPGAPGGWRWTDRDGGGPLLDIGIYLAFGIREMLGERIVKVAPLNCDTVAPAGLPVRDTTVAWFQTEKGIPGMLATTFSHEAVYINFFGTKGSLKVADCFRQVPGARLECRGEDFEHILDTNVDPALPHFDNYRREFEHFSSAVLDKTAHHPSPEEVISDALLLDALKQTIPSEAIITIPSPEKYVK